MLRFVAFLGACIAAVLTLMIWAGPLYLATGWKWLDDAGNSPLLIGASAAFAAVLAAVWVWQYRWGRRKQPFDEIRPPLRWWRR